eukprot:scaffold34759_cov37-Tisochrysis_lutea.AAC.1
MSTQRTHARVLRENELTASPRVSLLFNAHLSPISCHLSAPLLSLSLCICSPLRLWTGSPPAPPGPLSPSPFRPSPFIKMVLREPIGPKPFHKMVSASLSRRFPEELAALGDNVGLTVGEPLATPAQACRVEKMRALHATRPHRGFQIHARAYRVCSAYWHGLTALLCLAALRIWGGGWASSSRVITQVPPHSSSLLPLARALTGARRSRLSACGLPRDVFADATLSVDAPFDR